MKKILIIGGGAAGMMSAVTLAERKLKAQITLIERNPRLGQKVIISGGGRCNVTTGHEDLKQILKAYPRGANFLRTAMYEFSPIDMKNWVQKHGVPLKVEADLRIFPKSNKGTDVVRIFEKILQDSKVQVLTKVSVTKISHSKNFQIELSSGEVLESDILILTTGGQAYRHTGSKGDGYNFAEALGHTISNLAPSLCALKLEDKWTKDLAGLSIPNLKLRFRGLEVHEFTGPAIFTHKGISGPAVFALSALSAFEKLPASLELDFLPDKKQEQITADLNHSIKLSPLKKIHNILAEFLPHSLSIALCEQLQIDPNKKSGELAKKDLNRIVQNIKQLKLKAIARSAGDEFVTAGGVNLNEVDSKTMESKICPGLYFAGEILNIDGFTGGYNLQASWASGRLAGKMQV